MKIHLGKGETLGGLRALSKAVVFPKWSCTRTGNVLEYRGIYRYFGTVLLLLGKVPKRKIRTMWTTFVLVSSLVSTVHFSVIYTKVLMLKPVQYGQA
jgi:hypothetical protein